MKFVCLVHVDPERFKGITPEEQAAVDADALEGDRRLLASGHLITAGPLAEPETATLVRIRDGKLSMTDGPYVETKEHLGGLVIIEAENREQAIELLGNGKLAAYGTFEIREHWSLEDFLEKEGR